MLTSEQKHYMLTRAYVPEHTVSLITYLSGGEPFLIDDFFVCRTKDWVILIGFPFEAEFDTAGLERVIDRIRKKFNPEHLSLTMHESCGHPSELDRALGYEANYAGTSFLTPDKRGWFRYGSSHVNLVADNTEPETLAATGYDDGCRERENSRHAPPPIGQRYDIGGVDFGQVGNLQLRNVDPERCANGFVELEHLFAIRLAFSAIAEVRGAAIK